MKKSWRSDEELLHSSLKKWSKCGFKLAKKLQRIDEELSTSDEEVMKEWWRDNEEMIKKW